MGNSKGGYRKNITYIKQYFDDFVPPVHCSFMKTRSIRSFSVHFGSRLKQLPHDVEVSVPCRQVETGALGGVSEVIGGGKEEGGTEVASEKEVNHLKNGIY